ncbi:MAG: 16S rRNA (cytidine(1402)-2'-O)-methyltransferase [Atopococcus tabaci]|uniref:Ribosomal RNA small subunit methyltransferase I n=1 Tax=Atopococcus tabaci TaxID=269774 RepID=A0AA43UCL4_9LACT|nr:16S rRNA (cytidine(1402)-2'-O)-methyltransferase [Atopococcus tabaci]
MQSQKSFDSSDYGKLYLVPTPIGNLDDMTFRAIDILKTVDYVAAEDTRHTMKLFNHFSLETPLLSYHEHNKEGRIPELVNLLKEGKDIAQVSDAGTPIISDPGYELVQACLDQGVAVIPLPGANAAVTALIASGISPQPFYFYGFLSQQKKNRRAELENLAQLPVTFILYESPHRLKEMLKDAVEILGGSRQITLARELTKKYEEILRGSLDEAVAWSRKQSIRGEFCLVIEGSQNQFSTSAEHVYISYADHVRLLMDEKDISSKEAIKEVAILHNVAKRLVYHEFHEL